MRGVRCANRDSNTNQHFDPNGYCYHYFDSNRYANNNLNPYRNAHADSI